MIAPLPDAPNLTTLGFAFLTLLNTILLTVSAWLGRSDRRRRANTAKSVERIEDVMNGDRDRMIKELAALRKETNERILPLDNAAFERRLQSLQHENENLKTAAIVDDARRRKLARDAAELNELAMRQANGLKA